MSELLAQDDEMESIEIGDITVGVLNVGDIGGDSAFAYRTTVPVTVETFTADLVADVVAVQVGRSVAGLNFQSTFSPTDIDRIVEYSTLAVSRLPG